MSISSRALAAITPALALAMFAAPALSAPSLVTVTLNNQPITTSLPDSLGMAMPGADMSKAMMTVTASPSAVPAGDVTFVATNKSGDFTHKMILIKVGDPKKPLPFIAADSKVNEAAAGHLGEVSELDPDKSGSPSMKLDPGTYMLLCNVAGHCMAGMWTTITVQ